MKLIVDKSLNGEKKRVRRRTIDTTLSRSDGIPHALLSPTKTGYDVDYSKRNSSFNSWLVDSGHQSIPRVFRPSAEVSNSQRRSSISNCLDHSPSFDFDKDEMRFGVGKVDGSSLLNRFYDSRRMLDPNETRQKIDSWFQKEQYLSCQQLLSFQPRLVTPDTPTKRKTKKIRSSSSKKGSRDQTNGIDTKKKNVEKQRKTKVTDLASPLSRNKDQLRHNNLPPETRTIRKSKSQVQLLREQLTGYKEKSKETNEAASYHGREETRSKNATPRRRCKSEERQLKGTNKKVSDEVTRSNPLLSSSYCLEEPEWKPLVVTNTEKPHGRSKRGLTPVRTSSVRERRSHSTIYQDSDDDDEFGTRFTMHSRPERPGFETFDESWRVTPRQSFSYHVRSPERRPSRRASLRLAKHEFPELRLDSPLSHVAINSLRDSFTEGYTMPYDKESEKLGVSHADSWIGVAQHLAETLGDIDFGESEHGTSR